MKIYEGISPTIKSQIPIGSYWQEMYTSTSKGPIVKVINLKEESISLEDTETNQKRRILLSDFSRKFVPITANSSQNEPTKIKQTNNPFNIGDRIRSILTDNPMDRPKGKEFTVVKIYGDDVYYINGFAAHYSKFELVSRALDESTQVESTNQQIKEKPMTIQQLLQTLFGAEKPTTDYDKRPAIIVVAYNRDGSQMGQAIADNIDQVKSKVADTPELWGCKVLTYTLDQEVSVEVPVKAIKAKVAKSAKE